MPSDSFLATTPPTISTNTCIYFLANNFLSAKIMLVTIQLIPICYCLFRIPALHDHLWSLLEDALDSSLNLSVPNSNNDHKDHPHWLSNGKIPISPHKDTFSSDSMSFVSDWNTLWHWPLHFQVRCSPQPTIEELPSLGQKHSKLLFMTLWDFSCCQRYNLFQKYSNKVLTNPAHCYDMIHVIHTHSDRYDAWLYHASTCHPIHSNNHDAWPYHASTCCASMARQYDHWFWSSCI